MQLIPRSLRRRDRDPEGAMTLVEHLEELRTRLFIALGAVALASVIGWVLYPSVLSLLQHPFCQTIAQLPKEQRPPTGCQFVFSGVIDPVIIKLKVVAFLGLIIALPVVLYQLWAFVVPGLTRRERRMAIPFIATSVVLFLLGVALAYWTLPKALHFLIGFGGTGLVPILYADRFLSFMMLVAFAFGLSFEFPIVLVFLALAGVISSQQLRSWRRGAIVFIAVFAAVITPSQDPYTMLAMTIPMVIFYEAAIIVTRLLKR